MASSLSLLDPQYHVLLDVLGDLFNLILFCGVFAEIRWIVDLWSAYLWILFESLWILICMIWYLCKSLRTIDLVWPTRLVFLAMGEVLSFGFNLAVPFPSDSWGSKAHIVLLPSRIKRWGFSSYFLSLSLFVMSSYLRRYSVIYELNTLDAC